MHNFLSPPQTKLNNFIQTHKSYLRSDVIDFLATVGSVIHIY